MSGNFRQITSEIIDTPSQRRNKSKRVLLVRGGNRNRQTPDSREEWAEVLAEADKYY
jgi:hypothetical protein